MRAAYNEIDAYCCAWLSNLMDAGLITPGAIYDTPIQDLDPGRLAGFDRVHCFAGIAGWELALNLAGWPDDRPVWTGSCPCQPLSVAGSGKGHDDERHLWPAFHALIAELRPATVFGEQVDSPLGREWLSGVRADLEDDRYAVGAASLCAASVGAPHIRQRLFWVGHAEDNGRGLSDRQSGEQMYDAAGPRRVGVMADAGCSPGPAEQRHEPGQGPRRQPAEGDGTGIGERRGAHGVDDSDGIRRRTGRDNHRGDDRVQSVAASEYGLSLLGDAAGAGSQGLADRRGDVRGSGGQAVERAGGESAGPVAAGRTGSGTLEGFWRDADRLLCRDGKWRATQPGTFPLASGIPNRMGQLRAYGNAIVPQVAAQFILAFMECEPK